MSTSCLKHPTAIHLFDPTPPNSLSTIYTLRSKKLALRVMDVQLAVNRQPAYRQRNSKCKHCRQNNAKILEMSPNHESTNHHQLARWSTAAPSEASRAHMKTMGQCLVRFYEHYFLIILCVRKRCSVWPVLRAQCMYEDCLWSKVRSYVY